MNHEELGRRLQEEMRLFGEALPAASGGKFRALEMKPLTHPLPTYYGAIMSSAAALSRDQKEAFHLGARRPIPHVIGGAIDEGSINACAFPHDGRYYIGVNWGTLVLLHLLFRRLMTYPDVLPWVGDPGGDGPRQLFRDLPLTTDLSGDWRNLLSTGLADFPRDPLRRQAADALAHMAYTAIGFHEFRHIAGGHLDYRLARGRSPLMSEANSDLLDPGVALPLQAMERDADMFAIYMVFGNFLHWMQGTHPDGESTHFSLFAPGDLEVVECTLLCMDATFKVFDMTDPEPPDLWPRRSHPPGFIRRSMFIDRVMDCVTRLKASPQHHHAIRAVVLPRVIHISETIIPSLFGSASRRDFWSIYRGEGLASKALVERTWDDVEMELRPFRYYDIGMDRGR